MQINWFPGHMTKSMRMMEDSVKLVDLIIYVLDSRAPFSCLNPNFENLIGNKPIIYVLNKADLGVKSRIDEWIRILSTQKNAALSMDSTASGSASVLAATAKKLCEAKLEKYRAKGARTTVKAMVIGVPNCGKSTLINCLCKNAKTITGNKAGVTRGKQWVRVNDYFEVLDTPGTLYPKLTNQVVAQRLAFIGSVKDEVVDTFELALLLIEELKSYDADILKNRYKVELEISNEIVLEKAAKARGYILKGGIPDTERMAAALLDDFRKGRLGKITLERAEDYDL